MNQHNDEEKYCPDCGGTKMPEVKINSNPDPDALSDRFHAVGRTGYRPLVSTTNAIFESPLTDTNISSRLPEMLRTVADYIEARQIEDGAIQCLSVSLHEVESLGTRWEAMLFYEASEEVVMDKVKTIGEFFEKHPEVKVALVSREPTAAETATAFRVLQLALLLDRDFAWGWHCNIAMAAHDEGMDPKAANRAAARFMKNCFDVDVKEFEQWKALGLDVDTTKEEVTGGRRESNG